MPVFQRYVKGKRCTSFSKMRSIPARKKLLERCSSALFPLHFRQNLLNTWLPPFAPGRYVGGGELEPADPSPERRHDHRQAPPWDQEAQGSPMLPGASAHDQGSRNTGHHIPPTCCGAGGCSP